MMAISAESAVTMHWTAHSHCRLLHPHRQGLSMEVELNLQYSTYLFPSSVLPHLSKHGSECFLIKMGPWSFYLIDACQGQGQARQDAVVSSIESATSKFAKPLTLESMIERPDVSESHPLLNLCHISLQPPACFVHIDLRIEEVVIMKKQKAKMDSRWMILRYL